MKTLTIKTRWKKKRRNHSHIPALTELQLHGAFALLKQSALPAAAKQQLAAMLTTASNPNAERPDVVLRALEPDRQADAAETMRAVGAVFGGAQRRGRDELSAMPDNEWAALVDEG